MYIVKIMKRKDVASVVVAIVLGYILLGIVSVLTSDLSFYLSGMESKTVTEWRANVVQPLMHAALQIILLEALLRIVIYVRPLFVRRKR